MSRCLFAVLVALPLLNAAPCLAQSTERTMSVPVARELLASSDPKDQAWGAWMAGRLLMTDATPLIERVIKDGLSADDLSRWARASIGLDALIEIGAKPDVQLLDQTRRDYPVQSLILLSRLDRAADRVLLSMMADSSGYQWFATANMLKERRAAGFAALLLKDLHLTAEVQVSLDGRLGSSFGGGAGAGIGDKAGGDAPGYPPWTVYEFRSCRRHSLVVLAKGPTNVCFEKARAPMGLLPALSSHYTDGPTDDHRLAFFELEWSPIRLRAVEQLPVTWKSEEATKAALAAVKATVFRKYSSAIRLLTERGWLTTEEATRLAQPAIREVVTDLRLQQ